jgi:S-disulfanyl-L-cysteine oxidoreductase SoxD
MDKAGSITSMHKLAPALFLALFCTTSLATPPRPHLGEPANPGRIAAWDLLPGRDGSNLPPGRGSVSEGQAIFSARCAMCHGAAGIGKPADRLTGGIGSLTTAHPLRTVASYWPYATTLFGYIRIAMPINQPRSLSASDAYALCAYILSIDGIVRSNATLDASSLRGVKMPNRLGFRPIWHAGQDR